MRITTCLFCVLVNYFLRVHCVDEHVHFKIYVPDIVMHHIHTKTILVHDNTPKKRKKLPRRKEIPKTHHHEDYRESWSSWSGYVRQEGDGKREASRGRGTAGRHVNYGMQVKNHPKEGSSYLHGMNHLDASRLVDKPIGTTSGWVGGKSTTLGYRYPPRYSVHEDMEVPSAEHVDAKGTNTYEEGHREGSRVESGHLYTNEVENYQDEEEHDEDQEAKHGEEGVKGKNDKVSFKTNEGRFFLDEIVDSTESKDDQGNSKDGNRRLGLS